MHGVNMGQHVAMQFSIIRRKWKKQQTTSLDRSLISTFSPEGK
jgi:hypothetical protein